eukprot:Rmarinus@m.23378
MKLYYVFERIFVVGILFAIWVHWTDRSTKTQSLIAACCYSAIEFSWYSVTTEDEHGEVHFTPFRKTCRKGFTSWEQFWGNVLYTPILLNVYRTSIPWSVLRIALYPFNIWTLEIVLGYLLIYLFDRNVAWTYSGSDAYFSGNIKLSHGFLWIVLGSVIEFGQEGLARFSSEVSPGLEIALFFFFVVTSRQVDLRFRSSAKSTHPQRIWDDVTTPELINAELWPLFSLSMPKGLDEDTARKNMKPGYHLGNVSLNLFGFLPVDVSDMTIVEFSNRAKSFLEVSTMRSMVVWRHRREVRTETNRSMQRSRTVIEDRVTFQPRFFGMLLPMVVFLLFTYRHRRLRARYRAQEPAPPTS